MREIDDKILEAYQNSILERKKKFDLGSGHMGNGISVWNRAKEVHGDYEKIAHVDRNRKVKWYIKNPPKEVKDYVDKIIKGKNPNISATQSQKVFKESDEYIKEASPVSFEELPDDKKNLIMKLVGKNDVKNHSYFDGIHGTVATLNGKFGGSFRIKKTDLQKILKDKNIRWLDISSIGF